MASWIKLPFQHSCRQGLLNKVNPKSNVTEAEVIEHETSNSTQGIKKEPARLVRFPSYLEPCIGIMTTECIFACTCTPRHSFYSGGAMGQ